MSHKILDTLVPSLEELILFYTEGKSPGGFSIINSTFDTGFVLISIPWAVGEPYKIPIHLEMWDELEEECSHKGIYIKYEEDDEWRS